MASLTNFPENPWRISRNNPPLPEETSENCYFAKSWFEIGVGYTVCNSKGSTPVGENRIVLVVTHMHYRAFTLGRRE